MTAPIASPNSPLNSSVKDLTDMQLTQALDLCVKHKVDDPEIIAAVITSLALNFQTMKTK